jgi:hypothetical protein
MFMARSKLLAFALATALALAPAQSNAGIIIIPPVVANGGASSAGAFSLAGCVLSLMIAAIDKGNKYKQELTTEEALTCGLLYWIREASRNR